MIAAVTEIPVRKWTEHLLMNNGKPERPYAHLANCRIALKYAPEWQGVLFWNTFKQRIETGKKTPWGKPPGKTWEDHDNRMTADWLQHKDIHVNTFMAAEAVDTIAHDNDRDPLVDWVTGLQWDGIPRLDDWLPYFFGANDTPYVRNTGRKWLISAVARAVQPGCKADHCLILEGAQGIRKSSGLRVLAGGEDFFIDSLGKDLDSKESAILCSGAWIVEFAELEAVMSLSARTEVVKAFLTRTEDRYRPPYGKQPVAFPRRCVFAGTTNDNQYLHDITGNRRFWPVKCGDFVRIKQLELQREQLWAEAHMAYHNGEQWWLDYDDEKVAMKQQADRLEVDTWHDVIGDWLQTRKELSVSISEVLDLCLRKDIGLRTKSDEMRVARCLKMHGLEKFRVAGKGNVRWQ